MNNDKLDDLYEELEECTDPIRLEQIKVLIQELEQQIKNSSDIPNEEGLW